MITHSYCLTVFNYFPFSISVLCFLSSMCLLALPALLVAFKIFLNTVNVVFLAGIVLTTGCWYTFRPFYNSG